MVDDQDLNKLEGVETYEALGGPGVMMVINRASLCNFGMFLNALSWTSLILLLIRFGYGSSSY